MAVRGETGFYHGMLTLDTLTSQSFPSEVGGVKATSIFLTVEGANVRYRYDGGLPTQGSGHLLTIGSAYNLEGPQNVKNFRVIAESGNPVVRFTLEKS